MKKGAASGVKRGTLLLRSFDTLLGTNTRSNSLSLSIWKLPALKTYVQCPSVSTGILSNREWSCVCEAARDRELELDRMLVRVG